MQLASTTCAVMVIVATVTWKAYAEDKIDEQIKIQTTPIKQMVDKNAKKIEQIEFTGKQTLFLLKKMASKKDVKSMEEQTEIFRPKE